MQDDRDDISNLDLSKVDPAGLEISRLLKLKRFEQPEPEYFQRFLEEFKERQRSQLLREPAWRIAWDRLRAYVCATFGEQMPARLGYGLASTAVLAAAAITSINILESRPVEVASLPEQRPPAQTASLNLDTQFQLPGMPSLDRGITQAASISTPQTPRYVMDARPVSYEPPSSF